VGKNAYNQYTIQLITTTRKIIIYGLYVVEINPEVRMPIVTIHAKCVKEILSSKL
jgi:hypothetical protein